MPYLAAELTTSSGAFSTLKPELITNAIISEVWSKLSAKKKPKSTPTWKNVTLMISNIYSIELDKLREQTLRTGMKRIYDYQYSLSKTKSEAEKRKEFLCELYKPPVTQRQIRRISQTDAESDELPTAKHPKLDEFLQATLQKNNFDLAKENAELNLAVEKLHGEIEQLKQENNEIVDKLNKENETLKQELENLQNLLTTTKQRLTQVYKLIGKVNKPKYVMQSFKRKNSSIDKWQKETLKWKTAAKITKSCKCKKLQEKSNKLKTLQLQNSNRKSRANKRKPVTKSNRKMQAKFTAQITEQMATSLKEANQKLDATENELMMAEEVIHEKDDIIQGKQTIQTRIGTRKIHPNVKAASYKLQTLGIAEGQVGEAIKTVITTMTDAKLKGKLPSKTTQNKMASEMEAINNMYIGEELAGEKDLTLKYDGTTKKGKHLVEVEVATKEKTFCLGVQETVGGRADDYVGCIQEMTSKIQGDILSNVSNTMTDRCKTNAAIDRKLAEITGNTIHSFRCAVHPLDTIQRQCSIAIKTHEQTHTSETNGPQPFKHRGESESQALLRAVDRLFHDSGSGLPRDLPAFLKDQGFGGGEQCMLYPRWVGNRFNILFRCGGLLYMYHEHIQEFFAKVVKPRNELHYAVRNTVTSPTLMPIFQALGIFDKYLTNPWMKWQGTRHTILETSPVFEQVIDNLEMAKGRVDELILGFDETAFGTPVVKDKRYFTLIKPVEHKEESTGVLRMLLDEATDVMKRQLADHLPGGIFNNPSENLKSVASSCSSNNISGERIFAMYDAGAHRANSAKISKTGRKVSYKVNKVSEFLEAKSSEEREQIIRKATAEGRREREKDEERQRKLNESIKEKLNESRELIEKRENNQRNEKEKIIENLIEHGLWESPADVEEGVKSIRNRTAKDRLICLKSQIKFRTEILCCKPERKLKFTKATEKDLADYLVELTHLEIPEENVVIVNILKDPACIVNFNFSQKWATEGSRDKYYNGSITEALVQEGITTQLGCKFDGEVDVVFQSVDEILADISVGDVYLYI